MPSNKTDISKSSIKELRIGKVWETNRKRWFAAAAIVGHSTLPTCGDRLAFEVLLNTSPAKEIRILRPHTRHTRLHS